MLGQKQVIHTELRDKFKQALDSNDKLFVGAISAPAAWYGLSDEVSKWLNNNLQLWTVKNIIVGL